jgi:hypothetical protein
MTSKPYKATNVTATAKTAAKVPIAKEINPVNCSVVTRLELEVPPVPVVSDTVVDPSPPIDVILKVFSSNK